MCMGDQFTSAQTGLERRNGSQAPPAKKKYINQSAKTTSRIIKLRYTEYLYKVHGGPIHPSTAKYLSIQILIKKVHGGLILPSTVKKIKIIQIINRESAWGTNSPQHSKKNQL